MVHEYTLITRYVLLYVHMYEHTHQIHFPGKKLVYLFRLDRKSNLEDYHVVLHLNKDILWMFAFI